MNIKDTALAKKAKKMHKTSIGEVYLFERIVAIELYEDIHLDFKSGMEVFKLIIDFYGAEKKIGVISNRVNRFSKSPIDFKKIQSLMSNVLVYCPVTYNHYEAQNTKLESQFFNLDTENFTDVTIAYNWVEQYMDKKVSYKT